MYQQYPRITKATPVAPNNKAQFSVLSPKTVKNMMKSSGSGISGFEKYQLKANPSKHHESRNSSDRKLVNYLNSLQPEGSKSKEDLRYVPVENISLFDESHAPMSARNPQPSGALSTQKHPRAGVSLTSLSFVKNFRLLTIFKKWASHARRQKYLAKRQQLADNLPWAKPYFSKYIKSVIEPLNEVKHCSPLIEVRPKNVYSRKNNGFLGFVVQ